MNILRDRNENMIEDEEDSESSQVEVKKMKVVDYLKKTLCQQTSTTSSQKGTKKIGNTVFFFDGQLLFPEIYKLTGQPKRSGNKLLYPYEWSTILPPAQDTLSNEITPYVSGTIGADREIETELAAFEIYVTEKMLQTILTYTNDEIQISQYYTFPSPGDISLPSMTELKALIGILFLFGLKKDSIIPSSYLWGLSENDIYDSVMSKERFEYLVRSLRFDEYTTRPVRKKKDPFAEIREIWEEFITKCSEIFRPSLNCTIDEMFVEFNGNCSFKFPLPKRPQKYGIKLILLCDSQNHYIMSGIPYLEKNKRVTVQIAENIVKELARPIRGTNIKVTYAKDWLNSVPLSRKMLNAYRLTTVGALHKDHDEIPLDMITAEGRPVGSSILVYNRQDKLQLCTRCRKEGDIQILLSNMNFESVIKDGKPYIIKYYNSFRRGVDTINKMRHSCSCSRQTTHWFIAIFFTILDFAGINALAIFNLNRSRYGKPVIRRNDFINKLALDLMLPYMKERLNDQNVNESVKNKIRCIIEEHKNYVDFLNNPRKYTEDPISEIYQDDQVPQPKQPVEPDLTPRENPPMDSAQPTKAINQIKNQKQLAAPDPKTEQNSPTRKEEEVKQCEIPSEQTLLNQYNIWGEIQARYPLSETNKPKQPILQCQQTNKNATNITTCLDEATNPSIQPDIHPVLNLEWTPPNFAFQQIQTLYTPDFKAIQRVAPFLPRYLNPSSLAQQIQGTYQASQPVEPIQSITTALNKQLNPPRPILQQMQGTRTNGIGIHSQSVKVLHSPGVNAQKYPPRHIIQPMQATYPRSQPVQLLQSSDMYTQHDTPRLILQPMQNTFQYSQPVHILQSSELNTSNNPARAVLQQMQATYPHNQPVQLLLSQKVNSQKNPIRVLTYPISHPAMSAQQVTSVMNSQQNSPHGSLQHNMQDGYQNNQQTQPVMSVFNANHSPPQIIGQLPSQFNLPFQPTSDPPRKTGPGLKKELSACGVCDSIGDKNFYVECSKCSVLLCIVHRKVQCTICINSSQSNSSYTFVIESKKGKCGLCILQGQDRGKFSVQCCKCLKFVCLKHRRMLCCFCTEA